MTDSHDGNHPPIRRGNGCLTLIVVAILLGSLLMFVYTKAVL